jgi:hypothetical protein
MTVNRRFGPELSRRQPRSPVRTGVFRSLTNSAQLRAVARFKYRARDSGTKPAYSNQWAVRVANRDRLFLVRARNGVPSNTRRAARPTCRPISPNRWLHHAGDLNGSSRSNGGNGLPPPLGRSTDMRSALSSEQEAIEIQHSLRTNVQGDPVRFT